MFTKALNHINNSFVYFSYRIIIDGPDGGTIFSGNKPRYDELYTLTNHYISGILKCVLPMSFKCKTIVFYNQSMCKVRCGMTLQH